LGGGAAVGTAGLFEENMMVEETEMDVGSTVRITCATRVEKSNGSMLL
jgi:hypothetical protein